MVYTREHVKVTNKGIGFLGLLTIIFVIAKLMNVVDWSWWIIFLPIYIFPAIFLGIALIGGLSWLILVSIEANKAKKQRQKRWSGS